MYVYNVGSVHSTLTVHVYNVGSVHSTVTVHVYNVGSVHSTLTVHVYNVGSVHSTLTVHVHNVGSVTLTVHVYNVGSVSAGNLDQYLPFILSEIQGNPKRQYLLLHSLKEVISCHYGTPEAVATLRPHVARIW